MEGHANLVRPFHLTKSTNPKVNTTPRVQPPTLTNVDFWEKNRNLMLDNSPRFSEPGPVHMFTLVAVR